MTSEDHDALSERDLAVATLAGRYIERREHDATPCVHDLLAAAAEYGDDTADVLRTVSRARRREVEAATGELRAARARRRLDACPASRSGRSSSTPLATAW